MKILSVLFILIYSSNIFAERPKLDPYVDQVFSSTLNNKNLTQLPPMVDLTEQMTEAKNQGQRGSCSFFAVMGMVEGVIKKDLGIDVNLSEEFLIYSTKGLDGDSSTQDGSNAHSNLRSLKTHGVLLEKDWGYQPSWFDRGLPCENEKADSYTAPSYCYSHRSPPKRILRRVIDMDALKLDYLSRNTQEMIKYLANEKRPITVSVPVNFDGWPNSGDVYHNESLRQGCITNPSNCGSHLIVLMGYDLSKKVFLFKNSWGNDWGRKGFGTITFDTIDRYAGWDVVSAKINGEINFPKDLSIPTYEVEKFEVSVKKSASDVSVLFDAKLPNVAGQLVYVSSFLTKDINHDLVTYPLELKDKVKDTNVRSVFYSFPETRFFSTFSKSGGELAFLSGLLDFDFIKELFASEGLLLNWRTTIYVHDDIEGYKILKRIYTPFTK